MNALAAEVTFHMEHSDKRVMNHMDPETKAVHLRLEAWAEWSKDAEVRPFPSITLLGRVIEQGISGAGQQGRPPVSMPDPIARVDAAVGRLGDIDKRAIMIYYRRWEPIEVMARRMKMRPRQFQNVLRRARWRLQGYLAALEA